MVSIDNFRKMVLSLKNIEELPHFEKTSFRVNKKIVATLDLKTKQVVVKLSEIEQSVFSAYDKTIIYPVNGTWGKQGWTIIKLENVKKEVLKDALQTSYNNVAPKTKIKKTCSKGHTFYKSSDCPVCPICEQENKPSKGFLSLLSAPAKRALEEGGIKTLKQLSAKSKKDILALHGIGPSAIPILEKELKANQLSFMETKKTDSIKKATKSDSGLVTNYLKKLSPAYREILEALRTLILKTDKEIGEHIKWNSPAFYYTGEMKAFDPKEYKRDLVVVNLSQKNHVLLVFPTGASIKNTSGILEGDYKDGRRMVKIHDLKELKTKEKGLKKVIKEWLKLIDK
jgi:hypothetical protein